MISRMRMRIFVPVLILVILFPLLSWGIFSSVSGWYMNRLARQGLTVLMDSVRTMADETYSGKEPANMDEEKERSREFMSQVKTLIRKGQPQAQLLAMNTRLKLTYPKEEDYRPDTQALYQVCRELVLNGGQDQAVDSIHQITIGDTRYLVSLHETEGTANIRGKYLFGYISVPNTHALLSYTGGLLLLIAFILSILALTAAWFVAGSIARPLKALCRQTRVIGQGRFSRITEPYPIQEIEELRCSFNRMAEELEQMHQQQTTFFQNASHELRTPLMSICGYAQGIQHNVFTDHEEAAGIILSESMRMKELVDGILTLSKMDSRLITPKLQQLDLNRFAGDELSVLKGMEITEHISMELIPSPRPVIVTADPSLLSMALRNVISNCARYAAGQVVVSVSEGEICESKEETCELKGARCESDGRQTASAHEKWAVITIMDDGPGFREKDLSQVFDRFYKGPDGNFGIGLSVVLAAMKYLGGRAEAGNRKSPEQGAVFTLKLHL